MKDRIFHFVRRERAIEWMRLGWLAYPSLEGTAHGQWSVLMEWICDCRVVRGRT